MVIAKDKSNGHILRYAGNRIFQDLKDNPDFNAFCTAEMADMNYVKPPDSTALRQTDVWMWTTFACRSSCSICWARLLSLTR